MTRIAFTVPGEPQGKGRARSAALYGRDKKPILKNGRVIVTHYTPSKTVAYEGLVSQMAAAAMGGRSPLTEACRIDFEIVCSVPRSWSEKKRRQALAGEIRPAKKPDCDNVIKAVKDGINGVVWLDDTQGVDGGWTKRYGVTPGVRVTVAVVGAAVEQLELAA